MIPTPRRAAQALTEGGDMKTTTTTREYDTDGHMVKETVTEYDSGPIIGTTFTINGSAVAKAASSR